MSWVDKKINELYGKLRCYKPPKPALTIEQFFIDAPAGDFKWDEDDPGDPHVYYCDDCKAYHKWYTNTVMGRKNGKLYIELHTGDEDGNWDVSDAWEEGESSDEILRVLENETGNYFKDWAEYDLACAESGKDLLTGEKRSKHEALASAEENIKFLFMSQ